MRSRRPSEALAIGHREAVAIAANLGRQAREARLRRRLSQSQVAARIGLSRARYAELERGDGTRAPLELWVQAGLAIGRPLAATLSWDSSLDGSGRDPIDAGHLAAQELVLRLGRDQGRAASVELPIGLGRSPLVADVVLRDDRRRVLILVEIVNRAADLGALARATDRKVRALEGAAVLAGGNADPYRIAAGWLLTDIAANRRLGARYPEFLRTRCPGSSTGWARALTDGGSPPERAAVAWIDPRRGRIYPLRWRAADHGSAAAGGGRRHATLPS